MDKYVQVLIDIKKLGTRTFSYLIPDKFQGKIKIGQALSVPFGKSRTIKAYVVGFSNYLEDGIKAKYIDDILDDDSLFSMEYLKLLEFVSNYYFSDIQSVLKLALPQKFFQKNVKKYQKPRVENKIFKVKKEDKVNVLTDEQKKVVDGILNSSSKTSLIYGITGSGKTEVYFELIKKAIEENKNVLFLAPEIALVSQLTMRTIKRFGKDSVAIWHSSITDSEKYKVFLKLRNNEIKILFGARSAVFAPIKNLGLIIIDEEHDSSYKQSMPNPRYNAKLVASELAKLNNARLVMGSATPDIVSYYKAVNTNSLFCLKSRYNQNALPSVVVVDMKRERLENNNSLFSRTLKKLINETLDDKKQVILLINRRGFSTYTQCMECGEVIECPKCAIPLVYHAKSNTHRCHYCNYETKLETCPKCNSMELQNFGLGSERVLELAGKQFKNAVIERLDSDVLTKKNEHVEILERFNNHEIDILVGTQMIAKGLDNPNVTLVGVINADLSFNLPDFRSSERGFSILTQVAGRAGRGDAVGKVVFQTYNEQNLPLLNAKEQDFEAFFENEMNLRSEYNYPPFSKIIRIILSSPDDIRCERASMEIAIKLNEYIQKLNLDEQIEVLGPTPCVIEKLKGVYRYNILIKNMLDLKGHNIVLQFLRQIILPNDIKMVVDVDPEDIL